MRYGGRLPVGSAVLPKVKAAVEKTAVRFNCSKSLVVTTALMEFFGIPNDDRFDQEPKK